MLYRRYSVRASGVVEELYDEFEPEKVLEINVITTKGDQAVASLLKRVYDLAREDGGVGQFSFESVAKIRRENKSRRQDPELPITL